MKIAIYGDSYTAGQVAPNLNPEPSWIELLAKKFGNITVFGAGGSSVYYSYKNFLETQRVFDKIIFFASFVQRLYINNNDIRKEFRHVSNSTSMTSPDVFHKESERRIVTELLDAVQKYYLYLYDGEREEIFRNFMLKDLKERRPDIILFDVEYYMSNDMDDVAYYRKTKQINFSSDFMVHQNCVDLRQMHFSLEKTKVLADIMTYNLQNHKNHIDYDLIKNAVPTKSFNQYFVPIENIKVGTKRIAPIPGVITREL
jgi:hypothetical protein